MTARSYHTTDTCSPASTIYEPSLTSQHSYLTLSAVHRFMAAALASTGVEEHGGTNRGQMVNLYLRNVGLHPGTPWCAAFVHHIGWWSQYDPLTGRSTWTLPATGECTVLGDFAACRGALRSVPEPGSVFLLHSARKRRFSHAGVVLTVDEIPSGYLCHTVEGNTSDTGNQEGTKSCLRVRTFSKDTIHRFIAWWEVAV